MAELANITPLNPDDFSFETYSTSDENLLNVNFSSSVFNPTVDYVEFFIYDLNNNIINSVIGYDSYSLLDNNLYVDPINDTISNNIDTGVVNVLYNFYQPIISSSLTSYYYISEISSDRTELRLKSNDIPTDSIISSVNEFIQYRNSQEYFPDFYLNFGDNQLVIANNIKLDNGTVLIKLYESLPSNFNIKSILWVVNKISEGAAYQLDFNVNITQTTPSLNYISGPNYNLGIQDQLNNSSEYTNFQTYTSASVTSSQYQINSLFNTPGIEINVDYTDFSNFVNFSSATERLDNFYYKVSLIESASNQLAALDVLSPKPSTVVATQTSLKNIIDTTITNFDGYEYYLYFESGSSAWPKTTSTYPYENASTGSVTAQNWITASLVTASNYDNDNQNYLKYSIPEYIRDDSENDQYMTFINMVGQFFDDYVWVYIKDTTEKYNADNRIDYGVSKELVAQVLRDFGIKLYQSNYGTSDLFTAFLGATESGSLFPFSYVTSSLPTPTGYEYVDTYISSSTSPVPLDDIQKRVYKRIYHNLPYLLKTKGTIESIRTLATIYGIPDTLLQINEFGGKDKDNSNDWDLWQNKFNYKFDTEASGFVSSSWIINNNWVGTTPSTVQFRFKTPDLNSAISTPSQSLWSLDTNTYITLEYTGSGYTSGSYSGSIANLYNQYAHLTIYPDSTTSASVYLPFFNGGWWSVMATLDSDVVTLYAGNSIYSGSDGSQLGFYASQSISGVDDTEWLNGTTSYFASASIYPKFSGSLQEIRYYDVAINEGVFQDYIMNPQSIEGNGINSGSVQLAFRASLGGELYTGSNSIHPKVTGSWEPTSSFTSDSSFFTTGSFTPNTEYIFLDQFPAGLRNRNTDKIRQANLNLPTGDTLSNQISIQQKSYTEGNYTPNVNLLEVTYSPQNEINDDIISSIGYFNIGDYIGDPRLVSSSATYYPDLNALRDEYFLKYIKNYDLADFVRLIKYFDNSFFKMVKDFVPARTSLASGITIKQHLLERQKYPTPQAEWTQPEYTGSIGQTSTLVNGQREYIATTDFQSIPIETITGSNGGAILTSNVTQSWDGVRNTPVGQLSFIHDDESEFINGEFSGSIAVATDGELNPGCNVYKVAPTTLITYNISGSFIPTFQGFVNQQNLVQGPGEIHIWWEPTIVSQEKEYAPGYFDYIWSPAAFTISKESANGIDLDDYIPSVLNYIFQTGYTSGDVTLSGWTPSYTPSYNLGNLELEVINIQEYTTSFSGTGYYLIQLAPNSYNITVLTDNPAGTVAIAAKSNIQTVFTPYVPETFAGSDCNVIYGNNLDARLSDKFYDLDYSSNAIQAVNQQVVISASQQSGSATFAPVQDYNWYANRSILPRYVGSRSTSNGFNLSTTEGGFGTLPNVVNESKYFAYFNWVGGTSPEWGNGIEDRSAVNLRYFIDELGNVVEPINDVDGINIGICQQNFEETSNAILSFNDPNALSSNFANLIGTHPIFKSGKRITPIIYTQTASITPTTPGGATGSIEFVTGDINQGGVGSIPDFNLLSYASIGNYLAGDSLSFDDVINQGADITFNSPYTASTLADDPSGNGITLYLEASITRYYPANSPYNRVTGEFQWYKNGSPTGSSQLYNFQDPYVSTVNINLTDASATTSNYYELKLKSATWNVPQVGNPYVIIDGTSYININQQPLPNTGPCTAFWTQSGVNANQIKALGSPTPGQGGLKQFYGQRQADITSSGFFPITNQFIVELYDEIRFEGTETQTYKVMNIDTTGGEIILTLDKNVTATNLNWFLLRRYIDDPSYIILDIDKPAGGTSEGILSPQYLYSVSKRRTSEILKQLKSDNLI